MKPYDGAGGRGIRLCIRSGIRSLEQHIPTHTRTVHFVGIRQNKSESIRLQSLDLSHLTFISCAPNFGLTFIGLNTIVGGSEEFLRSAK